MLLYYYIILYRYFFFIEETQSLAFKVKVPLQLCKFLAVALVTTWMCIHVRPGL